MADTFTINEELLESLSTDLNVTITPTGSISVGTSESRSSETFAAKLTSTGRTLSQSGDVSLYSNASATVYGIYFSGTEGTLLVGGTDTSVKVDNSASTAVGIYGNKLTAGYLTGADRYTVDVYANKGQAYGLQVSEFTEDFDWEIIVSGSGYSYGIQKSNITFDKDFSGDISVRSRSEYAYGLSGTITTSGDFGGKISVRGQSLAYGISGSLTVSGNLSTVLTSQSDGYNAYGISGNLTVAGDYTGSIESIANTYYSYGINGNIDIDGDFGGSVKSSGRYEVFALNSSGSITIGDNFSGTIEASNTQNNYAVVGIRTVTGNDINVDIAKDFAGTVTVNSKGNAWGIDLNGDNSSSDRSTKLHIGGDLSGNITSVSTGYTAYGIKLFKYGKGTNNLTIDGNLSGMINVSGNSAYGINLDHNNNVASSLEIKGDISGIITAGANNGNAYGIYVNGKTGALSIGNGDEAARLRFCERVFVRFYLQKNRKKATAAS